MPTDALHATKKTLAEAGDKVDDDERQKVQGAIDGLDEALKGEDSDAIEAKMNALSEASAGLAEKLYADADPGAAAAPGGDPGDSAPENDDNTVDAEFEEVKDEEQEASTPTSASPGRQWDSAPAPFRGLAPMIFLEIAHGEA